MPLFDRDFWESIFVRAPIITSCMLLGAVIGGVLGAIYFDGVWGVVDYFACVLECSIMTGIALGLVIGVIIDSLVGVLRKKDKDDQAPSE